MRKFKFLVLIPLLTAAGLLVRADRLTLTNGDRISGDIVRADKETLVLKTDFMGEVKIKWDAVTEIQSDEKLFVTDENGQVLVGAVTTEGDRLQVETAASGTVPVSRSAVASIRSEAEQEAYLAEIERLRDPGLLDFWGGNFDTGLSVARGNADTTTFTASAHVARVTKRDKIGLYLTTIYAQNSASGDSMVTANAIRGGTRYDIQVRDRTFAFGFADFEFDEFQDLDLRSVFGGGLGWNVKKTERTAFDVFGGASFNQEFFEDDLTRRSAEAVIGEELLFRISEGTVLTEKLTFFPNLSETGEYRLQFDASLAARLNDWLAWQVAFSDRYLSNPPPNVQENDVLVSTGLRFTFGKR